ncbi:Very long-chain specific acyl-CoA dehydrogenase, mitochondrial [Manis javanica]|nr:Very long-chain specific acyl-CoA dehydrogenase, mitochondrial [Manis javanica]
MRTRAVRDGDDYPDHGRQALHLQRRRGTLHGGLRQDRHGSPRARSRLHRAARSARQVSAPEKLMGIRGGHAFEVSLDGVRVPASHRLGAEGTGFKTAMKCWTAAAWTWRPPPAMAGEPPWPPPRNGPNQRLVGGEPLQPETGHRLADMKLRLEASWALTMQALALRQAGQPFTNLGHGQAPCVRNGGLRHRRRPCRYPAATATARNAAGAPGARCTHPAHREASGAAQHHCARGAGRQLNAAARWLEKSENGTLAPGKAVDAERFKPQVFPGPCEGRKMAAVAASGHTRIAGSAASRSSHASRTSAESPVVRRAFRPASRVRLRTIPRSAGHRLARGRRRRCARTTMPTGGGKSLCYQVPAIVPAADHGVAVVVALITLMHDWWARCTRPA